jgi:hypothetical protein
MLRNGEDSGQRRILVSHSGLESTSPSRFEAQYIRVLGVVG